MYDKFSIVFLFSGQGSQYRQMGAELFIQNKIFRNCIEESDGIFRTLLGRSLITELYYTNDSVFEDLIVTHPAIVAVEIAIYKVLIDMGIVPNFVSGNSLGEFASCVVSEVWSLQLALEAAIEQAKSIIRDSPEGAMLLINHKRDASLVESYLSHGLVLSGNNFTDCFTLSGLTNDVSLFQKHLKKHGIQFVKMPVTYPFHSPFIEPSKNGFLFFMSNLSISSRPSQGFVSGIKCEESVHIDENYLWDAVSKYTDFTKIISYFEKRGPCFYVDLGPSGASATLVKYNIATTSRSIVFPIITPFKNEMGRLLTLRKVLKL